MFVLLPLEVYTFGSSQACTALIMSTCTSCELLSVCLDFKSLKSVEISFLWVCRPRSATGFVQILSEATCLDFCVMRDVASMRNLCCGTQNVSDSCPSLYFYTPSFWLNLLPKCWGLFLYSRPRLIRICVFELAPSNCAVLLLNDAGLFGS